MNGMASVLRAAGAALLMLALPAGSAWAQQASQRSITFGVSGGVVFPVSDFADGIEMNTGFTVLGYLGWQPQYQAFGVRGEVSYNRHTVDIPLADANVTMLGGALNGILTVSNDGQFRPYVIGGAGVYNVKGEVEAGSLLATLEDQTRLGVNGGVGALFRLGGLSGSLEARYMTVFLEDDVSMNVIPITLGLVF